MENYQAQTPQNLVLTIILQKFRKIQKKNKHTPFLIPRGHSHVYYTADILNSKLFEN